MTEPLEREVKSVWQDAWRHFSPDILMYGNWYCHIARIDGALRIRRLDPSSVRIDDDGSAWVCVAAGTGGSDE